MPTLTFQKNALTALIENSLSDEELREAITMLGTDIDSFGEEISVEIFPNRPDLLSVPGLARALNTFLGWKPMKTYTAHKGSGEVHVKNAVAKVRPHTRCCIVRGLSLSEDLLEHIIDLQEKLHITFGRNRKKVAIGIYPLQDITLPITYTAKKPKDIVFTPLEMNKKLSADKLLAEHPTGKTYAHLLEGAEVYPVFLDAESTVLSVPPIINSKEAGEVTVETTDVFVECSGSDGRVLMQALNIIVCALADLGGEIEEMTVLYESGEMALCPDLRPQQLPLDRAYVAQRAGIPEDAIDTSLEKAGLVVDTDVVHIPPFRTDFWHPVDLVEEAAIGYGYTNITPTVPDTHTIGGLLPETTQETNIRAILSGLGMQEVMNWHLTSRGVPLANPLTEHYTALRSNLLDGVLDVLKKNTSKHYPQHLYELGVVFSEDDAAETAVAEKRALCAVLCGESASYTSARQALQAVASTHGWDITFAPATDERFIEGRCARVTGDVEGVIGEIHPQQLVSRGVVFPTSAFDVRL